MLVLAAVSLVGVILVFRKNKRPQIWLKFATYLGLIALNVSVLHYYPNKYVFLVFLLIGLAIWELARALDNSELSRRRKGQIWLIYYLVFMSFIGFAASGKYHHVMWAYVIIVTFDGFAQITGQLFGRKQLTKISPNKTVGGVIGGAVVALVCGIIMMEEIRIGEAIAFSLLVMGSGFLGDLTASWVKRQAGIKDFSQLVPGHGGILDRFDSWFMVGIGYLIILLRLWEFA